MSYISGETIHMLRENKKMTQSMLAERISVSDKTVSKWETGRGLPDITILPELAKALGVSIAELMTGNVMRNENTAGNMKKTEFYCCPICGNIIAAAGSASVSCCGVTLPKAEAEAAEGDHEIEVTITDGEYYVHMQHPMTKAHSIRFFAMVTDDRVEIVRQYPEQDAACRFSKRGIGTLYACCSRHGLFRVRIGAKNA